MKRLIAAALFIAMIMSALPLISVYAEETKIYSNEAALIEKLGIIEDFSNPYDTVTRGEFSKIVTAMIGMENIDYSSGDYEAPFYDVPKGHKYFSEIKTLKDLNIVKGDAFKNFYPDEVVSKTDASIMLLNAFGYRVYAEANGAYPIGYELLCSTLNLWSGIDAGEVLVNKNTAVKLLYNTLFIDCIEIDEISSDGSTNYSKGSENILSRYHNVSVIDGVLVDDGFYTLTGNNIGDGKVVIRDSYTSYNYILNCDTENIPVYFGCNLQFFVKNYKDGSEPEIIHAKLNKNAEMFSVPADKIISYNGNYIEYEKEDETYGKIRVDSEKPYVVKNGEKLSDWGFEDLYSKTGIINLYDSDGDNSCDFIEIIHFEYNIITDMVSVENERITCKINPLNNLPVNEDDTEVRIVKNGAYITLSDIKEFDVVSVAAATAKINNKSRYILYVSDSAVKETVVSYQNDYKKLSTDKNEYTVSPFLMSNIPNYYTKVALNKEAEFIIDSLGHIAYFKKDAGSEIHYAYLINISAEHPVNPVSVFYYDKDGIFKESTISNNIVVDNENLNGKLISGSSATLYNEFKELISRREDGTVVIPDAAYHEKYNKSTSRIIPKPAIIKVNSQNEITYIDTAYSSNGYENETNDPYMLKATASRVFRNKAFQTAVGSFDSQYFITNDTTIIKVPDIDRYGMDSYSIVNTNYYEQDLYDISNYEFLSVAQLKAINGYDAQAYNIDENTGVADFLIIRGDTIPYYQSYKYNAEFSVFEKLTEIYDETKEEQIYKLYYKVGGDEKTVLVDKSMLHIFYQNIIFGGDYPETITAGYMGGEKTETVTYKKVEPLSEGDIISLESENGYLTHIQRDLDLSKINEKSVSSFRPAAPQTAYGNNVYTATNIGFPFDQRNLVMNDNLDNTYQCELMMPIRISGKYMYVGLPTNEDGTALGTFGVYINKGYEGLFNKYILLNDTMKITVVEETFYNKATGESRVKIRNGDISDIKTSIMYGDKESSRLYAYGVSGKYTQMVILNLQPEHNGN